MEVTCLNRNYQVAKPGGYSAFCLYNLWQFILPYMPNTYINNGLLLSAGAIGYESIIKCHNVLFKHLDNSNNPISTSDLPLDPPYEQYGFNVLKYSEGIGAIRDDWVESIVYPNVPEGTRDVFQYM